MVVIDKSPERTVISGRIDTKQMTDDMSTENLGPAEITNHLTVIIKL
jgi:hypothetical protein